MRLCLDLGSTSFKAAVFDSRGTRLGESSRKVEYAKAGVEQEIDPGFAREAFHSLVDGSLRSAGAAPRQVKAAGVASQAQTFAVARLDGSFKTSFMSWMDKRAASTCDAMERDPLFQDFGEHSSFGRLLPNLQLCLAKRLSMEGAIDGDSLIVPLPSYFIRLLAGRLTTDDNIAAMSGFFSLKSGGWRKKALAYCGLKEAQMPSLCETGRVVGTAVENEFGIPEGVPVVSCGNDQTAGAYGAALHRREGSCVLLTLGTASVAYEFLNKMSQPSKEIVRGPYPFGGCYKLVVDSCGGALVDMAIRAKPELKDFNAFSRLASEAAGNGGHSLALAFDESSNSLTWSGEGSLGQHALSVAELLAERAAKLLERLRGGGLQGVHALCAGGGSHDRLTRGLIEAQLGMKLDLVEASPLDGVAAMVGDCMAGQGGRNGD